MSKKNAPPTCPSCGVPFEDHLGLIGTCEKFREAFSALCMISAWAKSISDDDDAETLSGLLEIIENAAAKSICRIKDKGKKA